MMHLPLLDQIFQNKDYRWKHLLKAMVEVRHHLHQHPETRWEEKQTSALIRQILDRASISWKSYAEFGTVAILAPNAKGKHIALRGDMDALPLVEKSGVDWSSKEEGKMHACGHDGHTATLMTTVLWLKKHEHQLPGPVSCVFQPAEEGGHGAREMMKAGALEGVDEVFGWHNWPAMPLGKAVCPDGPVMAANGTFHIHVKGKGGHSSQPELCQDPVLAASAITLNLQQIVARKLSPHTPAVVSVTSIEASSGETIIPDTAYLHGSIRLSHSDVRDQVNEMIKEIAERTAKTYGVKVDVELRPRYPATVNHATQAEAYREVLEKNLGENWQDTSLHTPIMASEDFSYYLENIPGAFALIGSDDGISEHSVACHNTSYDFNDKLIESVSKIFCQLVGVNTF